MQTTKPPVTIVSIENPVKAGFPSPATDYHEERIDLTRELISHPLSTFIINSEGDSMIDAFIPPKAKLVIDRSQVARNGDIVLMVIDGEFTVKYLKKNDRKCWLVPANKKYKEITLTPEMNWEIWGVVIWIIVNPKDTQCML